MNILSNKTKQFFPKLNIGQRQVIEELIIILSNRKIIQFSVSSKSILFVIEFIQPKFFDRK